MKSSSPHSFTVAALGVALLVAGCSTVPRVHTEYKSEIDYSRFKSFALLPLPAQGPASDPGLMLRVAEPARHTVVESLTAKGMREVPQAEADCTLNMRGQSLPRVEVKDWGYTTYAYRYAWNTVPVYTGEREVRTYEERTLVIEIFDNRSKEIAWVGWCKGEGHGQVQVEKLKEVIRAILAKFPPDNAKK
jgi:hypothetical protein